MSGAVRHGARLARDAVLWAGRSGRLWILLAVPVLVLAGLLVASAKVAVTTVVYTLF